MTIENLKEFFSQIGYNWTGKIFDAAWHVVPFESDDKTFAPKTFVELLQYEQSEPIPFFVFMHETEQGDRDEFEHCFRVTLERFISYHYDISDDVYGSRSTLTQKRNFTDEWLEFQKSLENNIYL